MFVCVCACVRSKVPHLLSRPASFLFHYNPQAPKLECSYQIFKLRDKERGRFHPRDPPNPCDCSLRLPIPHILKHTHTHKYTPHGLTLLSTLNPSHPHYYTAANPVSQIPVPWTPLRKSYWCCTFLHMLQHTGTHCPPDCLCLLQACLPRVFFCKSPPEFLHPIHNLQCLKIFMECTVVKSISGRQQRHTDKRGHSPSFPV